MLHLRHGSYAQVQECAGRHDADFFNVTAWRQHGDICAKYLAKGRKVLVTGWIQTRSYEGQDGIKRTAVDIIADNIEFMNPANGAENPAAKSDHVQESPAYAAENGFTQVDNDELPF